MKVALQSSFLDYYDHAFDPVEAGTALFSRVSTGGPAKLAQFKILTALGWRTPRVGLVYDLAMGLGQQTPAQGIVVYTDERAHQGNGKILLPAQEALNNFATHSGAEYIGHFDSAGARHPLSHRYLYLGDYVYRFTYESTTPEEWRSNCGTVVIVFEGLVGAMSGGKTDAHGFRPVRWDGAPLYAVDVVRAEGLAYAVDLNVAPQLRGTGIEGDLDAAAIYREITHWMEKQRDRRPRLGAANSPKESRGPLEALETIV